jgi:hypothetical protein
VLDAEGGKAVRKVCGVGVEDGDAGVFAEMVAEVVGELGVELEEEEAGIGVHSAGHLAGVAAFAGAELGDDARDGEVKLAGDPVDEDFGTGDDGSDLHGAL